MVIPFSDGVAEVDSKLELPSWKTCTQTVTICLSVGCSLDGVSVGEVPPTEQVEEFPPGHPNTGLAGMHAHQTYTQIRVSNVDAGVAEMDN